MAENTRISEARRYYEKQIRDLREGLAIEQKEGSSTAKTREKIGVYQAKITDLNRQQSLIDRGATFKEAKRKISRGKARQDIARMGPEARAKFEKGREQIRAQAFLNPLNAPSRLREERFTDKQKEERAAKIVEARRITAPSQPEVTKTIDVRQRALTTPTAAVGPSRTTESIKTLAVPPDQFMSVERSYSSYEPQASFISPEQQQEIKASQLASYKERSSLIAVERGVEDIKGKQVRAQERAQRISNVPTSLVIKAEDKIIGGQSTTGEPRTKIGSFAAKYTTFLMGGAATPEGLFVQGAKGGLGIYSYATLPDARASIKKEVFSNPQARKASFKAVTDPATIAGAATLAFFPAGSRYAQIKNAQLTGPAKTTGTSFTQGTPRSAGGQATAAQGTITVGGQKIKFTQSTSLRATSKGQVGTTIINYLNPRTGKFKTIKGRVEGGTTSRASIVPKQSQLTGAQIQSGVVKPSGVSSTAFRYTTKIRGQKPIIETGVASRGRIGSQTAQGRFTSASQTRVSGKQFVSQATGQTKTPILQTPQATGIKSFATIKTQYGSLFLQQLGRRGSLGGTRGFSGSGTGGTGGTGGFGGGTISRGTTVTRAPTTVKATTPTIPKAPSVPRTAPTTTPPSLTAPTTAILTDLKLPTRPTIISLGTETPSVAKQERPATIIPTITSFAAEPSPRGIPTPPVSRGPPRLQSTSQPIPTPTPIVPVTPQSLFVGRSGGRGRTQPDTGGLPDVETGGITGPEAPPAVETTPDIVPEIPTIPPPAPIVPAPLRPTPRGPTPPFFPVGGFPIPNLGFPSGGRSIGSKFFSGTRQPRRYTPSTFAIGLDIRGTKPSKRAGITGLALRPIITKKKKKKKQNGTSKRKRRINKSK